MKDDSHLLISNASRYFEYGLRLVYEQPRP
jgi:hypothetical protein